MKASLRRLLVLSLSGPLGGSFAVASPESICARIAMPVSREETNALLSVTARGDAAKLVSLLSAGANPNARYENGRTLLMEAASQGRQDMLDLLWDAGATPFGADRLGRTIKQSITAGNSTWLDIKLSSLAQPKPGDEQAWKSDILGRKRQALCARFDSTRRFPTDKGLVGAIANSLEGGVPIDLAIVRLLAETVQSWQTSSPSERQPLAMAASFADPRALEILLANKAAPNAVDVLGRSAVTLAVQFGRTENLSRLLNAGGLINPPSSTSQPLPIAIAQDDLSMVKVLLERGVSLAQRSTNGATAIASAVNVGNIDIARLLLEAGADPNGRDGSQRPALVSAVQRRHPAMITLLLAHRADAGLKAPDGMSSLDLLMKPASLDLEGVTVRAPVGLLPDDKAVLLEPVIAQDSAVDSISQDDLMGDAARGYTSALDAQVDALILTAHRLLQGKLDVAFGAGTPNEHDAKIDEILRRMETNDRLFLQRTSELAAAQANRAFQVQLGMQQRRKLDELRTGRKGGLAKLAATVDAMRRELDKLRLMRGQLTTILTGVEDLKNEFQLGRSDPLTVREKMLREQRRIGDEKLIELKTMDEEIGDMVVNAAAERARHEREVAQTKQRLDTMLRERRETVILLTSALTIAESRLEKHLGACNTTETIPDPKGCHKPLQCDELNERNAVRSNLQKARQSVEPTDPDIRALTFDFERDRAWATERMADDESRHQIQLRNARAHREDVRREYDQDMAVRAAKIIELELPYAERKFQLQAHAEAIQDAIQARYGDEDHALYQAAAQIKLGLAGQNQENRNALFQGWAAINRMRNDYGPGKIEKTVPEGLDNIGALSDDINSDWATFSTKLDDEELLVRAIGALDAQRQTTSDKVNSLTASIDVLQSTREDDRRDLDLLRQSRGDQPNMDTLRSKAERAVNEIISIHAQLLREAFLPARERTMGFDQVRFRMQTLRDELAALDRPFNFSNPLLSAIDDLSVTPLSDGSRFHDQPEGTPTQFVALTYAQSDQIAAYWFSLIDFGADDWLAANADFQGQARLAKVFRHAMSNYAKFDRAVYGGAPTPVTAYRFISRDGTYWIRADGSLRSFLERDQDALFNYTFRSNADSPNDRALRAAYRIYVARIGAAYPHLTDPQRDLVHLVDASFRALDKDVWKHRTAEASWKLFAVLDTLASATPAIGWYYGVYKLTTVAVGWDQQKDELDVADAMFDMVQLIRGTKYFAYPERLSLAGYSSSLVGELVGDFTKSTLFHYDRLLAQSRQFGQVVGLGTQEPFIAQFLSLRKAIGESIWVSEANGPAQPTAKSQWSGKAKPVIIDARELVLTRVTADPFIYIEGGLTAARRIEIAACLGMPLLPHPIQSQLNTRMIFGVATNLQSRSSCIVFVASPLAGPE
jgi:ankyrin repeat protein